MIRVYMLALALWGDTRTDRPAEAETRESKPELYVHVPWQFALNYTH